MSTDVINIFGFEGAFEGYPEAMPNNLAVEAELKRIHQELADGSTFRLSRAVWQPPVHEDEGLRFVSAWGPDFGLQDYLVRRLGAISPSIKIINMYREEYLQVVGVRVAWLQGNDVVSATVDDDLSAAWDELDAAGWDPIEDGEEVLDCIVEQHQAECLQRALASSK